MNFARWLARAAGVLLFVATESCGGGGGGDDTTGPPQRRICLSVSGFDVTVANLWNGGGSHTTNVRGLAGFNETISRGNETHTLVWTNIQNNYTTQRVDAFNVRVDAASLSYPGNRC